MKKLSIYLRITALMLAMLLIMVPLTSFAEEETAGTDSSQSNSSEPSSQEGDGAASEEQEEEWETEPLTAQYTTYAENDNFILGISDQRAWIKVTDKRSGKEWFSTPPNYTADTKSPGKVLREMESQIIVQFTDKGGNENFDASAIASVKKDGLKIEKIENGALCTYNFPDHGFTVPVKYILTEDGFEAQILYSQIEETIDLYSITGIVLLPYFGACTNEQDGYLFIPDGCGALVDFKKATGSVSSTYTQTVYGRETAKQIKAVTNFKENVNLPVFGIKQGNSAFLGIIESGDGRTNIIANSQSAKAMHNSVCANFLYREYDKVSAKEKTWGSRSFKVFEAKMISGETYKVSYKFLNDENANYVGMANCYRQYLEEEEGVQKTATANDAPLYLDLMGGVKRPVNVLGFPINKVVPLTTFEDVESIVKQLNEKGVHNIVINYKNWYAGCNEGIIPTKLKPEGALGGTKKFLNMNDFLSQNGAQLFANVNMTDLNKSGNGFSRTGSATRGLDKQPAMIYFYDRPIYQQAQSDVYKGTRFLLAPQNVLDATKKMVASAQKNKLNMVGIANADLAQNLYSNFGKEGFDRLQSQETWEQSLAEMSSYSGQLLVEKPNAYALKGATRVTGIPSQSSNYYFFTDTVPFYQIVLHGFIPHSTISLNEANDLRQTTLKALETGSGIKFTWVAQNERSLKDTIYDSMINNNYQNWIDEAVSIQNEIAPILSDVSDKMIVKHEILQDGVYRTTFEGGITITVNYNYNAVEVDGKTIQAQGYDVVGR